MRTRVVWLLFALSVPAAAAAPESFARFERWIEPTRTLRASFVQTLESGALGADVEERGTVVLSRPGLMRWDYEDPEIKVAIIREGAVQMYLPEDGQLILSEVPPDGDLLPRLLLGEAPLGELFEILEADGAAPGSFRLVPKSEARTFEAVDVTIDRQGALTSAVVTDAGGNRMIYRFDRWKRNRPVPASTFDLEVPAGTDVVQASDLAPGD